MKVRDIRLRPRSMTVYRRYGWGPVAYRRKRAYYGPDHHPPKATDLRWTACVQEAHNVSWDEHAKVDTEAWRLLRYQEPEQIKSIIGKVVDVSEDSCWRLFRP